MQLVLLETCNTVLLYYFSM